MRELLAQAVDNHFDRFVLHLRLAGKDEFVEALLRHRVPRLGDERLQQGEFARREFEHFVAVVDRAAFAVETQAPGRGRRRRIARRCACRTAPRQRTHARFQLVQVEGLGQVIVGAGVQPDDAIAHRAAGGQDQHGRGDVFAPGLLQDLQAVEPGQGQVEHDHLGRGVLPGRQRRAPVAADFHFHAASLQGAAQRRLHRRVVFDQQHFHGRHNTTLAVSPRPTDSAMTAVRGGQRAANHL